MGCVFGKIHTQVKSLISLRKKDEKHEHKVCDPTESRGPR